MEQVSIHSHKRLHPVTTGEEGPRRTLHFGTLARQSCLDIDQPHELVLAYTRWIMTALLFPASTDKFLLLGLGGGAMAHFLLHHHPGCHLDSVERSDEVIKLAHDFFKLPHTGSHTILCKDVTDFILEENNKRFNGYDVAFIDIFEPEQMAAPLFDTDFLKAVLERLGPDGVMAVNLWKGDSKMFRRAKKAIKKSCDGRYLFLPVDKRSNFIVLAFSGRNYKKRLQFLKQKTAIFEEQYNLSFQYYLSKIFAPLSIPPYLPFWS